MNIHSDVDTETMELRTPTLSHKALIDVCIPALPEHPVWLEFYRRFDPWIQCYIKSTWHKCGQGACNDGCSAEVVIDLVQDVYVLLLKNDLQALRKFKGSTDTSFLAYLAIIAANAVREHIRKQLASKRKAKMSSIENILSLNPQGSYLVDDPQATIFAQVYASELLAMLPSNNNGHHTQRDHRLFTLYVLHGFTAKELASTVPLQLKASSIESIIRRMRGKLHQAIQGRHKAHQPATQVPYRKEGFYE